MATFWQGGGQMPPPPLHSPLNEILERVARCTWTQLGSGSGNKQSHQFIYIICIIGGSTSKYQSPSLLMSAWVEPCNHWRNCGLRPWEVYVYLLGSVCPFFGGSGGCRPGSCRRGNGGGGEVASPGSGGRGWLKVEVGTVGMGTGMGVL